MIKKTIQKEKSLRHDILSRLYDIRKSFVRNYEMFLLESERNTPTSRSILSEGCKLFSS